MTTSPREKEPESTTPQLTGDYQSATPDEGQSTSCSSSVEVDIPPLVNTVLAKSSRAREVVVNPARIEASLETLKRNRKLQEMGLG